MKKIVALMAVLAITSVGSAALSLNVITPTQTLTVAPSDIVTIQIVASANQRADVGMMIGSNGPAVYSVVAATNAVNPDSPPFMLDPDTAAAFGYANLAFADLGKPDITSMMPVGVVVDMIQFHCEGPGDVLIVAFDPGTGLEYGRVTIVQAIPEPMTLGLLGLGGLFLRRRLA